MDSESIGLGYCICSLNFIYIPGRLTWHASNFLRTRQFRAPTSSSFQKLSNSLAKSQFHAIPLKAETMSSKWYKSRIASYLPFGTVLFQILSTIQLKASHCDSPTVDCASFSDLHLQFNPGSSICRYVYKSIFKNIASLVSFQFVVFFIGRCVERLITENLRTIIFYLQKMLLFPAFVIYNYCAVVATVIRYLLLKRIHCCFDIKFSDYYQNQCPEGAQWKKNVRHRVTEDELPRPNSHT